MENMEKATNGGAMLQGDAFLDALELINEHELFHIDADSVTLSGSIGLRELAAAAGVPFYEVVRRVGQIVPVNEADAREWIAWLDSRKAVA